MAYFRATNGSGGSGGKKGASGVIASWSLNTEIEIDTGLSSVETFILEGSPQTTYGGAASMAIYDANRSTSVFLRAAGSVTATNANIGAGSATHAFGIISISGGKVTIKTPTGDAVVKSIYWSATGE